MDVMPYQDDIINVGIGCCMSSQIPHVRSLEYNVIADEQKQVQAAKPAGKGFRRSPMNLMSSFTKGLTKGSKGGKGNENPKQRRRSTVDGCPVELAAAGGHLARSSGLDGHPSSAASPSPPRGGGSGSSPPRRNSDAGPISSAQMAQLVAAEYFAAQRRRGPDPELLSANSLIDDEEEDDGGDASGQNRVGAELTCSAGSGHSKPSSEVSLALEVGEAAHEYLEECFYTEVSVLNREKFNAIPEIVKSDFTITGHLGKGSYSDVFEVVCKDGQLGLKMGLRTDLSHSISGHETTPPPPPPRRNGRGRRSTVSESINLGSLSRPPPLDDRKLVLAMKCLRPQIRYDVDQFTIGAEDLVHETAILANLNHRNIIKIYGRASGRLSDAFVLNDGYFILLDRLTGTLNDRIGGWKKSPKLALLGPTAKQIEIARSVADALAYLHSKNIVFRDLKPDNVGFDASGEVKLFDFGFAAGLPEKDAGNPAGFLFERCGTPRYMAPEVALSLGYGLNVDVYSFGVLLWEICALAKPFASIRSAAHFEEVVFMGGGRPPIKDHWPAALKELVGSCWSASPCNRPTMREVKSSLSMVVAEVTNGRGAAIRNVRRMTRRRSDAMCPRP